MVGLLLELSCLASSLLHSMRDRILSSVVFFWRFKLFFGSEMRGHAGMDQNMKGMWRSDGAINRSRIQALRRGQTSDLR